MIETILGVTGNRSPTFVYNGFKTLPKDSPWIASGNFPNKSPSGYAYAVADINIARDILTAPQSISKKSIMYDGVEGMTLFQPNIFTANGHRWKHARKHIAPAFSSNHIKRMVSICNKHLGNLEARLDKLAEAGKPFNAGKTMIHLTLKIIAEAAFEYDMTEDEMHKFTTNLETAAQCFVIMNPLHQKFPWLFPEVWRAKAAAKAVLDISYDMMANYRKVHGTTTIHRNDKDHEFKDDTIISCIMNNPDYVDDAQRAADISIFLSAGHDTTAYSIAWTLRDIFETQPPELQVYREKIKTMPKDQWKKIDELQYMIKEGMRLNPVLAMGTVRDVGKPITYMHGKDQVTLPKDSIYIIPLYPLFRNPQYYDDPDTFKPSRWADMSTDAQGALAHLPYSIGQRNCIGQTLATAEMHTVLASLCAKYDFDVQASGHAEYLTTLRPVGTLLVPRKREIM